MLSNTPLPRLVQVPSPNRSQRTTDTIDLVVVHDCQGSGRGAASYFATSASNVSAHLVLDESGDVVYQCVPLNMKAWHACNANPYSIGVEMGGYAEKGFSDKELAADALIVAWLLRRYAIPCRFVHGTERGGWTTHYRLGSFGGGHTDFTTDPAQEQAYARRVEAAYAAFGDGALPEWALHGLPAPHAVSLPPEPPAGFEGKQHQLRDDSAQPWAPTSSGYPLASLGDWQWRLRKAGANPQLQIDAIDGPRTRQAIKVFQTAVGLPATGLEDAATWAKLEAATR